MHKFVKNKQFTRGEKDVKKLLLLMLSIVFVFCLPVDGFANKGEVASTIAGEAYLNIPLLDWKSFDEVGNVPATLLLKEIDVKENEFVLNGEVNYNGKNYTVNYNLDLMKSISRDGDYQLISDDYNRNQDDRIFKLIHGSINFDTPRHLLKVSNGLEGNQVMSLYFYSEDSNDLIMFEQDISQEIVKKLKSVNRGTLENTDTDYWEHRFLVPTTYETKPMRLHDSDTVSKYAYYNTPWGVSTHKLTLVMSSNTSNRVGEGAVRTTLKVTEAYINNPHEPIQRGYSSIWARPTIEYTTTKNNTSKRDAIVQKQHQGKWSGGATNISLNLGIGYGPLTAETVLTSKSSKTIASTGFKNIEVKSSSNYSVYAKMDFSPTYIYREGQYYDFNVMVSNRGVTGAKGVRVFSKIKWDIHNEITTSTMGNILKYQSTFK